MAHLAPGGALTVSWYVSPSWEGSRSRNHSSRSNTTPSTGPFPSTGRPHPLATSAATTTARANPRIRRLPLWIKTPQCMVLNGGPVRIEVEPREADWEAPHGREKLGG
ncbi:hypothetical protein Pmi06nite_83300 [Planotetraspora mira]|uniref:Uncharacterized protein n=1 Tax=Planotetraspora mira TaxID=58121 RepID=A0A8J3TY85_9ACTN|nr:hypothetical protein Pmi06nite_83300 [Planotetraspora mira]